MNALALARLDDPLVGLKHALRRSGFPCTLASGLTSLQPANDVEETSLSYDEHASGSLFWTQKDRIRFRGGYNVFRYAKEDPINYTDRKGRGPEAAVLVACPECAALAVTGYILYSFWLDLTPPGPSCPVANDNANPEPPVRRDDYCAAVAAAAFERCLEEYRDTFQSEPLIEAYEECQVEANDAYEECQEAFLGGVE